MSQATRTVRADELNPGMVIEEVTELSFDYATLDEKSLKFLKNAFKGAKAVLVGEDGIRTVPIEQLKTFDPLQGIVNIPPTLKIASVVAGMGAAMEKYGLLEFKVTQGGQAGAGGADRDSYRLAIFLRCRRAGDSQSDDW